MQGIDFTSIQALEPFFPLMHLNSANILFRKNNNINLNEILTEG